MLKIEMIGNLGKDCIVNNVNGKTVINFSVAHTDKYTDHQGAPIERTTWVNCSYWTDRTSVSQYLKKGKQVYIEGQPEIKFYTGNDGKQKADFTCRVNRIQLLGGAEQGSQGTQPNQQSAPPRQYNSADQVTEPIDDLPF